MSQTTQTASDTRYGVQNQEGDAPVPNPDPNLPAQLGEREEAIVQTTKIRKMTVAPGVMRVPVDEVTTAENSEKWVVKMDHPVDDNIRFFLDKPIRGWSADYKLVRLLDWYGIADAEADGWENADPYALQAEKLYMEYDEEADDWALIRPPQAKTRLERASAWAGGLIESARAQVPSVDRTVLTMFGFIQLGIVLGAAGAALFGGTMFGQWLIGVVTPAVTTVLGLVVTEP